jgi:hypothetical protein
LKSARKVQWDVSSEQGLQSFLAAVGQARLAGKRVTVEIVESTRTDAQNSAMHLWFEMVAATLNAAGLDMRKTLKPEFEIPWRKYSVKEFLWRPLQQAMTGHESTTKPGKLDYPEISETLTRHFASKFGVQLPPWPHREAA